MIKKRYLLELEMEGKIDNQPVENSRKRNPILKTAKKIIDRFVADDEAVKSYFQSYVILGTFDEWDSKGIIEAMNCIGDYGLIFLKSVKGSEELEDFIHFAYEDEFPQDSPEYRIQEYAKNCLDVRLCSVQLVEVRFTEKTVTS